MDAKLDSHDARDLSAAMEDSLRPDRSAQWQPAFAAADLKAPKQGLIQQLKDQFGVGETTVADAGGTPRGTDDGSATHVASADGSNGFLNLMRGWLGRA